MLYKLQRSKHENRVATYSAESRVVNVAVLVGCKLIRYNWHLNQSMVCLQGV